MPRKSIKKYRIDIEDKMRALSIYRPEFEHAVNVLARTLYDYDQMQSDFRASGGKLLVEYTNKAGATNAVKNPAYLAVETLRQDILAYSKELGLTPAALKKIDEDAFKKGEKKKGLAAILSFEDAG